MFAGGQTITDIGTVFNISAYQEDGLVRTSLVEGAIEVNGRPLRPGQAARLADEKLSLEADNTAQTVAWQKGYFRFNEEDIRSIMKQLARYYDIEVAYHGDPGAEGFYMAIARNKKLSEVLRALERTQKLSFKIEGRRVTVTSKY